MGIASAPRYAAIADETDIAVSCEVTAWVMETGWAVGRESPRYSAVQTMPDATYIIR